MIRTLIATLVASFSIVSFLNAAEVNPDSAKIAKEVPIADLHLHPNRGLSPDDVRVWMDRNNVRWGGAGAKFGRQFIWQSWASTLGNRFIPFAGQSELENIYLKGGIKAMLDPRNFEIKALVQSLEANFKSGSIKGIGEIFINNARSNSKRKLRRKGETNSEVMRQLYKLAAKYNGFLTLHMEADDDSLEELETLLATDRRGRVLWNHCGNFAEAKIVREMLVRNPNLYCELSFRFPPVLSGKFSRISPSIKIFDEDSVDEKWLKFIKKLPDRFMIGTDSHSGEQYDGTIETVRSGLLPYLRPDTARKVTFENAKRLFDLK